jgi:hypothetical protein
MRYLAALALVTVMVVGSHTPVIASGSNKASIVRELSDAIGLGTLVRQSIEESTSRRFKERAQGLYSSFMTSVGGSEDPNTPEYGAAALRFAERLEARVSRLFVEIKLEEIVSEHVAQFFERELAESEMRELTRFFRSSVGRKFIAMYDRAGSETASRVAEKLGPRVESTVKQFYADEAVEYRRKRSGSRK